MILRIIEEHYIANHQRLIKKMSFRAGTQWAGEDVVHTAYERAIRYRRDFTKEEFAKWFSMILNNALRDFQAEEQGYTPIDLDYEEEAETAFSNYPENIMKEIYELIDTKSVDQMEVLNLFFKHGYSARDIPAITYHSYAKCHQIIQRFRNELKELYRE